MGHSGCPKAGCNEDEDLQHMKRSLWVSTGFASLVHVRSSGKLVELSNAADPHTSCPAYLRFRGHKQGRSLIQWNIVAFCGGAVLSFFVRPLVSEVCTW